mmetsp:Transcript_11093/g.25221  ORF Transcript_11093/g.25221 Transcript_11093/m.25221 type:complete len:183 (+) Transcript_11093:101-649(+)
MPHVHFSVGEDEATLLTVFVRGLEAGVDVDEGQTVEYAKNRAIDQLWQKLPFCHAATALSSLTVYEAETCREVYDDERVRDGMRLIIAHEPPSEQAAEAPSLGTGFAQAFADAAGKKLGVDTRPAAAKPPASGRHVPTQEELKRMSVRELRSIIADAGGSSADCKEKTDLVERALSLVGTSR